MAIEIEAKVGGTDAKDGAKERAKRVRIGLTGLALVFLLVLIGAAITNWSVEPQILNQTIANAIPAEPNEPLAEIGAAPGESSAANDAQNIE